MRVGRLLALLGGGLLVAFSATTVAAMIAAVVAKRRIVPLEATDAYEVRVAGIFGPMYVRNTATAFRGGTVDCWFGGGAIDLRNAILDPAGARLRVRAIFGGGQIVVPETWQVDSHVVGIGGLADGRPRIERADDAPCLTIEGIALFGGFAVMSDLPEAEERQLAASVARQRRGREPVVESAIHAAA